jgi:hypothetical protein
VDFCSVLLTMSRVRLGQDTLRTDPWVGGLLFCVTDHVQG